MTTFTNISLLKDMYNYQTKHKIKGQCTANTIFYIDMINTHFPNEKCIPIIGILHYYDMSINRHIVVSHCWCILNGKTIDPSLEFIDLPYKKTYYKNLNEYLTWAKYFVYTPQEDKIIMIKNTCKLQKRIQELTKNKKMTTDYYTEIGDYIVGLYS